MSPSRFRNMTPLDPAPQTVADRCVVAQRGGPSSPVRKLPLQVHRWRLENRRQPPWTYVGRVTVTVLIRPHVRTKKLASEVFLQSAALRSLLRAARAAGSVGRNRSSARRYSPRCRRVATGARRLAPRGTGLAPRPSEMVSRMADRNVIGSNTCSRTCRQHTSAGARSTDVLPREVLLADGDASRRQVCRHPGRNSGRIQIRGFRLARAMRASRSPRPQPISTTDTLCRS